MNEAYNKIQEAQKKESELDKLRELLEYSDGCIDIASTKLAERWINFLAINKRYMPDVQILTEAFSIVHIKGEEDEKVLRYPINPRVEYSKGPHIS